MVNEVVSRLDRIDMDGNEQHSAEVLNKFNISKQEELKVKITEKAGNSLESLLVRSDPFGGGDCTRLDCRVCLSKAPT